MSSSLPSSSPPLPESDTDSDISVASTDILVMKMFISHGKECSKIVRAGVKDRLNIVWSDSLPALKALEVPATDSAHWFPAEHSLETLKRLFPKIKSKPRNINEYKLLFCFRDAVVDGKFQLKGAVQNRITGKVAMMTAKNFRIAEKSHESHADGWWVHKADMHATASFWNAFKAC